ncbi:MAG TPA: site-specific integrase [Steroidobacteraceae bacterium]
MQAKITQKLVRAVQPGAADINITDASLPGFELRVRPSGAKSWVFRYRLNGGPQQRLRLGSFPGLPAEEARKLALAAAADVARGIDVQSRKEEAKVEAVRQHASTLAVFIEDHYEPWVRNHLRSWKFQIKRIKSDFESWFDKPMGTIDTVVIEKWRAERLTAGNQPVTVNRNLQRLHALMSKAVEWKVLERLPFAVKQLKTDRTGRVRYLEEEEEEQLRKALIAREDVLRTERDSFNRWRLARHKMALPARDETYVDHVMPMVLLALNTGMRRGELFQLKWTDVNLKTRWLTIGGRTSKSKQTRRLPLNREALTVLEGWRAQSKTSANPYVFPGAGNSPLTTITTSWRSVRKAADLRDFRFHDLRHHFASRLVQSGVDLNTVRELLGHADLQMVLRYAHLAPGGLASAVEKVARVADQKALLGAPEGSDTTDRKAA